MSPRFIKRRTVMVDTPPRYCAASFSFNAPIGALGGFINERNVLRTDSARLDYFTVYLVQAARLFRRRTPLSPGRDENSAHKCAAVPLDQLVIQHARPRLNQSLVSRLEAF